MLSYSTEFWPFPPSLPTQCWCKSIVMQLSHSPIHLLPTSLSLFKHSPLDLAQTSLSKVILTLFWSSRAGYQTINPLWLEYMVCDPLPLVKIILIHSTDKPITSLRISSSPSLGHIHTTSRIQHLWAASVCRNVYNATHRQPYLSCRTSLHSSRGSSRGACSSDHSTFAYISLSPSHPSIPLQINILAVWNCAWHVPNLLY